MLHSQDVARLLRTVRRWWNVIVLCVALAGVTSLVIGLAQPRLYQARVSLLVGGGFTAASPNGGDFEVGSGLTRFYNDLMRREVILAPVVSQLQLPFGWWEIAGNMLSTKIIAESNVLEVSITDTDPVRAAAITEAIAGQIINYSPSSSAEGSAQVADLDAEIATTRQNIERTDAQLAELEQRKAELQSAVDIRNVQDQIDLLQVARDRYQGAYINLIQLRNRGALNSVTILESVQVPSQPLPSQLPIVVLFSVLGALILGVLAAMVLDRVDRRVPTGADLEELLGVTSLGAIHRADLQGAIDSSQALPQSQALQHIHTQITVALASNPQRSGMLLVSELDDHEARGELVAALAQLYARSGHRVVVVDTDPSASALARLLGASGAGRVDERTLTETYATGTEQLSLVTGQRTQPGELLMPPLRWVELVERLAGEAEIVFFSGPSAAGRADAMIIARQVDGVVLTLNPARTSRADLLGVKAQIERSSEARLLGVVTVGNEAAASPWAIFRQARPRLADDRAALG